MVKLGNRTQSAPRPPGLPRSPRKPAVGGCKPTQGESDGPKTGGHGASGHEYSGFYEEEAFAPSTAPRGFSFHFSDRWQALIKLPLMPPAKV